MLIEGPERRRPLPSEMGSGGVLHMVLIGGPECRRPLPSEMGSAGVLHMVQYGIGDVNWSVRN